MKERALKGYFTVEAALVLPLVIGTIVFIIYFQLYWYNRCLMEQDTAMLSIKAVLTREQTADELKQELENWESIYRAKLYSGWEAQAPVLSLEHNHVVIKRSGSLFGEEEEWNATVSSESRQLDQAGFLRICRKVSKRSEGNEEGKEMEE